jgi:hypothetical protein
VALTLYVWALTTSASKLHIAGSGGYRRSPEGGTFTPIYAFKDARPDQMYSLNFSIAHSASALPPLGNMLHPFYEITPRER